MPHPAEPGSDRYHRGNLRQAILETARSLLEEAGPGGLSLREIARRLDVSAPSAYHHFASLDAIAVALAEQGFDELTERLKAATGNLDGRLGPAGAAYISFARANPGLYRLMFGEGFQMISKKNLAVRSLRQRAYATLSEDLRKRLPEPDVSTAALFLWSLVHGLALLMIDGQLDAAADPNTMIDKVLRLAGTGLPRRPAT